MTATIVDWKRVAGGFEVRVQDGTWVNGDPKFVTVTLTEAQVRGATRDELITALANALEDPLDGLAGVEVDPLTIPFPERPPNVVPLESWLIELHERWWRWQTVRVEATARNVGAARIAAVRAREDAAWAELQTAVTEALAGGA